MRVKEIALVLLLVIGLGIAGYGFYTGDQGTIDLGVSKATVEEESPNETNVVEFTHLSPQLKDGFREALNSDDEVRLSKEPDIDADFVRYQEEYYRIYLTYGAANKTVMIGSIAIGFMLALGAIIGFYFTR